MKIVFVENWYVHITLFSQFVGSPSLQKIKLLETRISDYDCYKLLFLFSIF